MSSKRPLGRKKQINTAKKQFLHSIQKYAHALEAENRQLKTDPNTLIGKVIEEYQRAVTATKRLSVLIATVIKMSGGKIEVMKGDLEAFTGMLINIKWQVPDDVNKLEGADRYTFTYDAIPDPQATKQQAQETPPASPPMPIEAGSASTETAPSGPFIMEAILNP